MSDLFSAKEENPVYIDDYEAPFGRMLMCHMACLDIEKLHQMADKIGVNRKWFQNGDEKYPHYDVCLSKKKKAISFGAIEVSARELIKLAYPQCSSCGNSAVIKDGDICYRCRRIISPEEPVSGTKS